MNASEIGSEDWWKVVQSSPLLDAEMLLRDYKSVLLNYKVGLPEYIVYASMISKVNQELHRIAQIQNRCRFQVAIKNIYGQEGVDAINEERARLEVMEGIK
jgi:hypothetical protein